MRGVHRERAVERAVVQSGAIRPGECVVVACSGGPDSVALAAILAAAARRLKLRLSLAHVNHGVRASAWQDECVAMRIAASLGLDLDVVAVPQGDAASEETLRDRRYEILTGIAVERSASAVVTAHHAEDQTETVLLALFRGSGPAGLAGMPSRRSLARGVGLARPLLRVGEADLRYYCHVNGLPYAVDPTNDAGRLRRNAVRSALQSLRGAFPGLDLAVARAAEVVGGERTHSPRAALRKRVREVIAAEASLADVDFEHVESAVRAMESGRDGRFFIKKGLTLRIERTGRKEKRTARKRR
ncbi:MAG: tRNA lysidine(34) synthetase TilS [Candidatus Tyrphobacter sp.]